MLQNQHPTQSPHSESFLLEILHGRKGLLPTLIRGLFRMLAVIYTSAIRFYLKCYELGWRKPTRLNCPVLCIGNITTGGTGKTPTVQTIARLLLQHGLKVSILLRGYGGTNEYGCAVVSDGSTILLTQQEAGDEAYLLAKTLPGASVIVGKDRIKTGNLAIERFQPDLILMDDGFQHWRVHRDLDIVLLNAMEPFSNGYTVPAGLLREPKEHIARAGVVLLTNALRISDEEMTVLNNDLQRLASGVPIFTANLQPNHLIHLETMETLPIAWLNGRKIGAFSGLGNPASFEATLQEAGAITVASFRFRDHRSLTLEELSKIVQECQAHPIEAIVTTEKDAVKLPPLQTALPIFALQVEMRIDNVETLIQKILTYIPKCQPHTIVGLNTAAGQIQ